jgi:predicted amidohydrolase
MQIMHGGGFAAILGPDGRRISEALSHDQEAMITADLDMSELDTHKGDKARFGDA